MTRLNPLALAGPRQSLRRRDQKGAALVEFALVVGVFAMVLYGLIYFGMAVATKQRVTNAAAEGARAAVGQASGALAQSTAQTRVISLLGTQNGRYTVTPVAAPCSSAAPTGPQCVTVTVTWDWSGHPVVPAAPGLGLVPISSLSSVAVVQYSS